MEPVKMKAPAPQIDTPSSQHEDADEKDATAHEFHESLNQDSTTEESEAPKVEAKAGGRKRRRASSSGVITA
jgi:ribonuclease E